MKKLAKNALASVLILSAFFLQGCSNSLLKLTYEGDQFINKREKLYYNYAPAPYEPVGMGEAYAHCNSPELTLYEITGMDPRNWLTEEIAGSSTTVFYNADIKLPTLTELDPDKIFICVGTEKIFSIATIDDKEAIDEIIRVFEEGEKAVWPLVNATQTYHLKFYSEKNAPAIYYNLIYGEFAEGNFLYEEGTERCVEVGTLITDLTS